MIKNTKFFTIMSGLGLSFMSLSQAQVLVAPGNGIKIKAVEKDVQLTPDYQAGNVKIKKINRPRDWLEIEVQFEADKVKPADAVLPELLFRYYVGMKTEQNQYIVLTGDVTHINVQAGQEYHSAVYVAPSTLGKVTGNFKKLDLGAVMGIGVEIFYNGVLVGKDSSNNKDFWITLQSQPGVLPREKTPFGLLWIDRYPETKSN